MPRYFWSRSESTDSPTIFRSPGTSELAARTGRADLLYPFHPAPLGIVDQALEQGLHILLDEIRAGVPQFSGAFNLGADSEAHGRMIEWRVGNEKRMGSSEWDRQV